MRMIRPGLMAVPGPAAVPIAAAAGSVIGGVLSNRSSNRATDAQSRAQAEALAFAKEQEAQRRKEYEERIAMERAQWEAREARRAEILARYGRNYTPRPYAPGAMPTNTATPAIRSSSPGPSYSSRETLTPPLVPPPTTLGQMRQWDF